MIYTENTTYKRNAGNQSLPGFDSKYLNIVDYILKITEEIWEERAVWVIYDTYAGNIPVHVGARTIFGVEEVVAGTLKTLASFPDRSMLGEAVIWSREGERHFYSSHRIGSSATNLGDTDFGKATGKRVFFRTIADCLITENKITEEWLVRDNLHLVQQLGFDPVEMAKKEGRYPTQSPRFTQNGSLATNGADAASLPVENAAAGVVVSLFENVWKPRRFDSSGEFYALLANLHAVCEEEVVGARQIGQYLERLLGSFPQAAVHLERVTCNETEAGAEVAARWKIVGEHGGAGFFGEPGGKQVVLPGISHYLVRGGKIVEEWMVFDGYDALCQIHANPLAASVPAKISPSSNGSEDRRLQHKKTIAAFFNELNAAATGDKATIPVFNKYLSPDVSLRITKPFGEIEGIGGYAGEFWQPLLDAFPDLEIQPYILLGGEYEGRDYVSCTGNFIGTFHQPWLGIPPNRQPTWLRFAGHFLMEKGKIAKAWYFIDMLDVLRQAGFNFLPFKGIQHTPPAPMTGDGILTYATDPAEGQKSLDLTDAMLKGLTSYDGKTLDSMGQERFWDVQKMMWYGPSGIGTTRGLKGFQDNHQIPFLTAFPDRGIMPKTDHDYFTALGDGNYSCDFGFPAMYGSHLGDGWLGLEATGKKITLRVVDYWRREGDRLRENWVLIDMLDGLEQLGVDVLELLRQKLREEGR